MKVLVWVDHDGNDIADATLSAITAASQIGEVNLLVLGEKIDTVIEAACRVEGVRTVYTVAASDNKFRVAENITPVVLQLMTQHDVFVAPATTMGKSLAPRVAALLDVMQISEVISVEGERTFKRPIYAGNAIATVKSNDPKQVITVRPSAFAMAAEGNGKSTVWQISESDGVHRIQFLSAERRASSRPELGSAKIVVSGGRALQSGDQFQAIIEPLADKLGAAVGASRAVVDAGWLPYNYQVGQTGKAVAPKIYFAIGISGAIQHLAGMRESKIIVAINKDADAPIFGVADIGLVADIFEAVPELTSKL